MNRRALLTRPRPQSESLAAALAGDGWVCDIAPMLEIAPMAPTPDRRNDLQNDMIGVQAVLFTSVNGVRAFAALRPAARQASPCALTVGDATAKAAGEAGFDAVASAVGNVEALTSLVIEALRPEDGPLLRVRGCNVRGALAQTLRGAGFDVREATLYRACAATALPPEAAARLRNGAYDAVLFHSPRTAAVFAAMLDARMRAGLTATLAIAISAAAAEPLKDLGFARMLIAARPDENALRTALNAESNGPNRR